MNPEHTGPLIREIDPPKGLFQAVLTRISHEHRRAARFQVAGFGLAAFISILLLIPAVQYAASEFYTSGFYDYASLFFDSLAHGYWKDLLYSLTESLPSIALLILATTLSTFMWSLRKMREQTGIAFTHLTLSI